MHTKGTPKTGGRQKGTPNRATVEVRAAAAAIVDDPVYRRTLARHMRARTVQPAIESLMWHYAKGQAEGRRRDHRLARCHGARGADRGGRATDDDRGDARV
jgi:hypothetical protein